jgi:hypothetical protein
VNSCVLQLPTGTAVSPGDATTVVKINRQAIERAPKVARAMARHREGAGVVEGGRNAASAASDEANHEEVRGNASV